jgi:hypothetical protein
MSRFDWEASAWTLRIRSGVSFSGGRMRFRVSSLASSSATSRWNSWSLLAVTSRARISRRRFSSWAVLVRSSSTAGDQ